MDLSQLEEGTGRSVPSTPLRTTAPMSIISEAAVVSKLAAHSSGGPTDVATSSSDAEGQQEPGQPLSQEER